MKVLFFTLSCIFFMHNCTVKHSEIEDNVENLKHFFITNFIHSSSFTLPSSVEIINEKSQNITLGSLFKSDKLVLRFTYSSCENCILAELENLKTLPATLKSNIVLLITYQSPRILKIIKEKYNIEFPVFFIDEKIAESIFPSELNKLTQPYLFYIDDRLICQNIFIPSPSFPELSKIIYHEILNKYIKHSSQIFTQNIFDFGEIKNNKEYQFHFNYRNPESYPLIINDVKPTCGCTVVDWKKSPLAPGATSSLTVKLTPDQTGYLFKKIYITYNQNKTATIAIKGIVK